MIRVPRRLRVVEFLEDVQLVLGARRPCYGKGERAAFPRDVARNLLRQGLAREPADPPTPAPAPGGAT